VVSSLIERYLTQVGPDGTPMEHSARTRTLLPLLRNAFLIVLVTVVAFIVLSEVGINIAPLLAGAGVVGLAIGFGSQSLVKDIITGLFILFEDTIAVGDVIDAGGHSGLVESISIRTIRMRDESGAIHTVPFSAVTSVVNMSRDYSFFVFTVRLAYREDTDRVVAVIAELGAELQGDPDLGPLIIAPIEIYGVEAFADAAVVVKGRIKTRTGKQALVGREFNRRLKKRFEELDIEMTFPQTTLYFGDRSGAGAPPGLARAAGARGRVGKAAAARGGAAD
jgi:small conductance mechanosensitive channel